MKDMVKTAAAVIATLAIWVVAGMFCLGCTVRASVDTSFLKRYDRPNGDSYTVESKDSPKTETK